MASSKTYSSESIFQNLPPAQDSMKNIVNSLNNDCLREVLRKLDNRQDYFNAANVCVHFQNNAQAAYPRKFKSLKIDDREFGKTILNDFLRIFGSLLKSIFWTYREKSECDILNIIAKYCGESLSELTIINDIPNFGERHLPHRYPFKTLEMVTLDSCGFISEIDLMDQLKRLTLIGITHTNIQQRFPKLEHFTSLLNPITVVKLNEFLMLNPQLKHFEVDTLREATSIFKNIANYGQSLETLSIKFTNYEHTSDLELLSRLKHLKTFRFDFLIGVVSLNKLLDAFASNDVRIENLQVRGEWDDIENIIKLKFLKKLCFETISEKQLIRIAGHLPKLKEIVVLRSQTPFTIAGITGILKGGKNLTNLYIFGNDYPDTITVGDYEYMLALVKGRVRVTIKSFYPQPILVAEDVLEANRKWLDISYLEPL